MKQNINIKRAAKIASISALSVAIMAESFGALPAFAANKSAAASVDDTGDDWLHTEGGKIVDKNGNEVWLTGANWFGFNCSENVFHGIWSANMRECIKGIADHGINIVRIPVSTEILYLWSQGKAPSDINVNWYNNPELVKADGSKMDSFEVFDAAMKMFKEYGIKVMVDVHSPDANNTGHNYELWYGKEMSDGTMVTTDMWIEAWVWLVDHYKNDDTLIAADLKNEPHGKRAYAAEEPTNIAKWDDSTDENNWRYAAEKCAKAILDVNPNILIMVEGVEQTPKAGYTYKDPDKWQSEDVYNGGWWGGNLRGVKDYPINLGKYQNQLVYSPHDYGPAVYAQKWFDKDFTEQTLLDDYWYDSWAYIKDQNIAPLLMGEWGGFLDGGDNEKWLNLLADYMVKNKISHTFWCLNPNSGDTGGLWDYGFSGWDAKKYALLEKTLWQDANGKYISLDHQRALGANGISVGEYYGDGPSVKVVPVTGVSFEKQQINALVGDTIKLEAVVAPANATNKAVKYSSNNPKIAQVASDGTVTILQGGRVTITATTIDGNKTANVEIEIRELPQETPTPTVEPTIKPTVQPTVEPTTRPTVEPTVEPTTRPTVQPTVRPTAEPTAKPTVPPTGDVKVNSIKLNTQYIQIGEGAAYNMTATVSPANATEKITWESEDNSIVKVSADGKVTGVKQGGANIIAKTADGRVTAYCYVSVTNSVIHVDSIWLNIYWKELSVGKTEQLVANLSPEFATNKNVTWTSSNPKVVTVDKNGKVTAVKAGSATVTATSVDGKKSATCQFVVK